VSRPSRAVWLAMAAGLVLRLAFGFGYWIGKPLTHDEREYLALAQNLATGRGFTYPAAAPGEPEPERFGRAPVYPLYLALVDIASGPLPLLPAIKAAQAAVGTVGIWLIAVIAGRVAGRRGANAAAWIAAVYPPLVWTPAYVFSETLYMALALANVIAADRAIAPGARATRWLWCGLVGGVAALTRPAHLFFLLLLGFYLLVRRRSMAALVVAAGALITVAPWTLRNWQEYGRPILIASEGGITFWTGNHPLSSGEGDMAANPAVKRDNQRLRAAHPGLSPEALEPIYYREAFAAIARDPAGWAGLLARKVFYTIVPIGPSYTLHSPRYVIASVVSYVSLLIAGVIGGIAVWRAGQWPVTLGLLLGSALLVCVVFFPQERFRIPVIDPALMVLAAGRVGRG
jgi:4-amino-4-deoxy-L-arabinose transferase-like glycosyltransferase